ncbi:hypothetical protein WBG06_05425 [Nocardioides sp. CCNWLW239]|uniref:hypothetical protein n=1 Tax=Nocardioides sp. CCNWLW239 TaxID=3128902 RepID=UPI00301A927B
MARVTDIRERYAAACGQPGPEPTLWMAIGPLIRENTPAETSATPGELAIECHLDRRD